MMLSTKARRVSVGARAGNARRSALRRGCGERFRTWAGKAWPIARGRGPGEPGTHTRGAGARPEGSRDADARKFGPEGHFADARSAEAPSPGPARAAGLGPGRRVPQDSEGRCGSGNADALGLPCSGEPGRLARWFGGKARRNPGRIPEGLEMPTPMDGSWPEPDPRGGPTPGNSPPGTACAARNVRDAAAENSAATGPKTVRRKIPPCSVSLPRSPREATPRTSSVQSRPRATEAVFQGADVREPARAAGLGPANGLAAGLGDQHCGSGNTDARGLPCSGEPGRLARWFGDKARRNPGRIPEGSRDAEAGAAAQANRSPKAARKESKPTQKRRSRLPAPGLSESATPCPESAAASSRQPSASARSAQGKKAHETILFRAPA